MLGDAHAAPLPHPLSPSPDDCGVNNLTEPVLLSLRHLGEGTDRMAAYWDFDVLAGYGSWRAEGCQLIGLELNVTTVSCRHLSNVAVLMVGVRWNGAGSGWKGTGIAQTLLAVVKNGNRYCHGYQIARHRVEKLGQEIGEHLRGPLKHPRGL